jgi:hypothetical protein
VLDATPPRHPPRRDPASIHSPTPDSILAPERAFRTFSSPRCGSKRTTPTEFYPYQIPRQGPTRPLNSLQAPRSRRDVGSSHDQNATCCGKEISSERQGFHGRLVAEESGEDRSPLKEALWAATMAIGGQIEESYSKSWSPHRRTKLYQTGPGMPGSPSGAPAQIPRSTGRSGGYSHPRVRR